MKYPYDINELIIAGNSVSYINRMLFMLDDWLAYRLPKSHPLRRDIAGVHKTMVPEKERLIGIWFENATDEQYHQHGDVFQQALPQLPPLDLSPAPQVVSRGRSKPTPKDWATLAQFFAACVQSVDAQPWYVRRALPKSHQALRRMEGTARRECSV